MEQQQDQRLVILDTETTGMPVSEGHRIVEIGCVEVIGRRLTGRHFHAYLQPDRESDEGAIGVHGITDAFLVGKPRFGDVADEFFEFIQGATLVIHNAAFDVGFLNNEFALQGQHDRADITQHCTILDTLMMARSRHPGQRNSLDALCKRYGIDNSGRELHGALLDSELLADVYLAMTGGQTSLSLAGDGAGAEDGQGSAGSEIRRITGRAPGRVIVASEEELAAHAERLAAIAKSAGGPAMWQALTEAPAS
ncbi:DNA polymerase III subunit epsilon [Pseudomonas xantholysinigenes]|uniref:DNA polymerase III subunit epsilon n=1 Tax=Pseudomonas xantholysinigenes TaxID=2745490 RepID=A0A9E6PTG1_9PSED|nr:DNA polymerase III subunit epsilon [Pseudomonas xantholysinigenes]QXI36854.1 DNA polymerase III subunit epsilon [Pseudomonas xantholysinigenes]